MKIFRRKGDDPEDEGESTDKQLFEETPEIVGDKVKKLIAELPTDPPDKDETK